MRKILAAVVAAFAFLGFSVPAQAATLRPISHVVLIVEENHSSSSITPSSMPFLVSQGNAFATLSHYVNVVHPSLGNYFALTDGSTEGHSGSGADCGTSTAGCVVGSDNIFSQTHGLWREWAQSEPGKCVSHNSGPYVVHHAIPPFYQRLLDDGTCATNDIPFPTPGNQNIGTAKFIFVTPDKNNDAHDGSLGAADAFLKPLITHLKTKPAYTNGSTLIEVTFDETAGGNNLIYTALINPRLAGRGPVGGTFNHYGLLRMNEELLGFPLLGNAQTANDPKVALGL